MHCAVIGSGIAGMSSALLLARCGYEVSVFESAPHMAPLLRGFSRKGLHFDTGFHYAGGLGRGGSLRRWLSALGVALPVKTILPCRETYFLGSRKLCTLECSGNKWTTSFQRACPEASAPLRAFFARMEREYAASPYLSADFNERAHASPEPDASLRRSLEDLPLSPEWRKVLAAHCLLFDVPPDDTDMTTYSLVSWPCMTDGALVRGGGKTLADAFSAALRQAGVEVRLSSRVQKIVVENGRVRAVLTERGETCGADACIYTGHPSRLESLLPAGLLRRAFTSRLRALPETAQPFMVFAETRCPSLDGDVCYLLPSGGLERFAVSLDSEDPTVFLSTGTPAGQRRPVSMVASAQVPVTPDPAALRDWKKATAEKLLRKVHLCLPELSDARILALSCACDIQRWIEGSTGSIYGVRHRRQDIPLLPVTKVEGLLLAGQNILLPGVLGTAVSAAIAAGILVGQDSILSLFRRGKDIQE